MADTKNKLQEVLIKIKNLDIVENEFSKAKENLNVIGESINDLLVLLEKKNNEIQKMDSFSLGGAIKSIFVDKNKALEDKRNEYYTLSQKYDKLKVKKSGIEFEYDILNKKLIELTKYKKEFDYLMDLRAKELLNENSSQGYSLKKILKEFDEEKEKHKKLNITRDLIDKLLNRTTLLSASLREVENYTSWKGRRTRNHRFDKRQAINRAKELNLECKLMLNNLDKLLIDINYTFRTLDLQLVNFENLMGVFFDNIISDFILQQNIEKAIIEVESVYKRLKKIKVDILELLEKSSSSEERLKEIRESIILDVNI